MRQWAGVLAGPLAWTVQLLAGYPVAQEHCHSAAGGHPSVVLSILTFGALAMIGAGAITARKADRRGASLEPAGFMAKLGLGTAALFSLLVVATAVALVLNACD